MPLSVAYNAALRYFSLDSLNLCTCPAIFINSKCYWVSCFYVPKTENLGLCLFFEYFRSNSL